MKCCCVSLALLGATSMIGPVARAGGNGGRTAAANRTFSNYPCDDAKFLSDQKSFENGIASADQFEDVCGTVTPVLPARKTSSGNHGYFYIQVASGVTIEIVSDLDQMDAPKWPWVGVGDTSYVQGRYYYDNVGSQGIDWTHHGTSAS